jgi:hypothetical protein
MDEHQFLARLVAAPVAAAITDVMNRALQAATPRLLHDVPCPNECGATVAVWSALNHRLYPPGGGVPLGTGSRTRVVLACRCGARRATSGRAVGRHKHHGLPLLS